MAKDVTALRMRLWEVATARPQYGYRRLHGLLRRDPIRPGRPMENAFVESLNGKSRDESLNKHSLTGLADVRATIEEWRRDYHRVHPQDSPGWQARVAPKMEGESLGSIRVRAAAYVED